MNIQITSERDSLAEAFAQSLATIESQVERKKLEIVEALLDFMHRENISRSELARRMGVRPSRITKLLSGDENLTIDTLVRTGAAVRADLVQTFVPQGHRVSWIHYPCAPSSQERITLDPGTNLRPIRQAPSPRLIRRRPADRDAEDAA